jgi:hypothetical protein
MRWTSSAARSGVRVFLSSEGAALRGQGDALPLAFPDDGASESGESAHDGEHEIGLGESWPVKTRPSLTNSTRTPLRVRFGPGPHPRDSRSVRFSPLTDLVDGKYYLFSG